MAQMARPFFQLLFPPECLSCRTHVTEEFSLCGPCWRDTPFIIAPHCDFCGANVLDGGDTASPSEYGGHALALICESCHTAAPPWQSGRSCFQYGGKARELILAFKHGDRLDLARPFARWLAASGADILQNCDLIVPVPLARGRLFTRRYNQAAVLTAALSKHVNRPHLPDALLRPKSTGSQEGRNFAQRHAALHDKIRPNPRHATTLRGKNVVLVDDVMASGATCQAATAALFSAHVASVAILTLARVAQTS